MPDVPLAATLRRLWSSEWPLLGAAAALLSLAFLPAFLPGRADAEREALARLRERFESRDYPAVEEAARAFLAATVAGPAAAEAHALRGRAALARTGEPGLAWEELRAARRLGFPSPDLFAWRRQAAHALLDHGKSEAAGAAFRELLAEEVDPLVALDLGRVLAARASRRPREAAPLAAEILELAEGCRRRLPPDRRLEAVIGAARLVRRAGRAEDGLPLLLRALEEHPEPLSRGRVQLERGRSLTWLDRRPEALAALDLADELLKDDAASRVDRDLAKLELHCRAGLPDVPALAAALEDAPMAARGVARLLVALWRASVERPSGLREIADALAELPSIAPVEAAGVDPSWIRAEVRAAALVEVDPAGLAQVAEALRQLLRLEPEELRLLLALGGLERRRGDLLRPADAAAAAARYAEAGRVYELATSSADLDLKSQELAAREGAEAFSLAGRPLAAAALFRRWYGFSPRLNAEGLLRQARALREARVYRSGGAIEAYADYVSRSAPGDPGLAEALLERGRLLLELGARAEAVADFDRLLRDDAGVSPETPEWEAALLLRGRALLELGQAETDEEKRGRLLGMSRRGLSEYLLRYAEDGAPRAGVVEASYLLARAAMETKDWQGAVDALARAAAADATDDRARTFQREARFLRGDLYFAAGRYDEAERAYADAARRHAASPDRLWGVVGRARSLARLGRLEEARREARGVRALYDEEKEALESSFGGRGKDYWIAAIETLEKEVR